MDLTVEIHGDIGSLEECLDQFTKKEWLYGDNMYKCDRLVFYMHHLYIFLSYLTFCNRNIGIYFKFIQFIIL